MSEIDVDVRDGQSASATHRTLRLDGDPDPGKAWQLTGPGLLSMPSPEYLAVLEDHNPGAVSRLMDIVADDVEAARQLEERRAELSRRRDSSRLKLIVGYAVLALLIGSLLIVNGFEVPGTFIALGGCISVGIGAAFSQPTLRRRYKAAPTKS